MDILNLFIACVLLAICALLYTLAICDLKEDNNEL